jgi:hypothetical protein
MTVSSGQGLQMDLINSEVAHTWTCSNYEGGNGVRETTHIRVSELLSIVNTGNLYFPL